MMQSDDALQAAREILKHVEVLLASASAGEGRERLECIRHAAMTLTAALDPALQEAQEGKRSGRILLVEDIPFTQKVMSRLLTQQGYEVTLAQNGEEAIALLKEGRFDLTLMDLRMPVLDGYAAATAIRKQETERRSQRMPIIAVTGFAGEQERKQAMEAGMDGFHAKPVRAMELFEEMERLLSRSRVGGQPETVTTEASPIVDMARLLKTVDGDHDLLTEITDLYFTNAPHQMARIRRAITMGEADEVRDVAHSLKGATGAFGQVEVFHLAFALEQAGRNRDMSRAEQLWDKLTEGLQTMERTIRLEINQLRRSHQ
ncbi:MAG: response regulator [Magnetococcales bacterium]|nr:response regulator [Magnetococcales bacterium]